MIGQVMQTGPGFAYRDGALGRVRIRSFAPRVPRSRRRRPGSRRRRSTSGLGFITFSTSMIGGVVAGALGMFLWRRYLA